MTLACPRLCCRIGFYAVEESEWFWIREKTDCVSIRLCKNVRSWSNLYSSVIFLMKIGVNLMCFVLCFGCAGVYSYTSRLAGISWISVIVVLMFYFHVAFFQCISGLNLVKNRYPRIVSPVDVVTCNEILIMRSLILR